MSGVEAYLRKRADRRYWDNVGGEASVDGVSQVVVIPVLAEYERLFDTLRDLAANDASALGKTMVVCVVNNRAPEIAGAADCEDNQRTLAALPDFAMAHPHLRLAWIDAASPGRELGRKDGVGLARKIGLDWGLGLLAEAGCPQGSLVCLDADTRVTPNYLSALDTHFSNEDRWAAVVDYAHPLEGPDEAAAPILAYEIFLRYQELAWRYAASPYAYPAIGSTMACTGAAYAASGGMNRRQAGEDFYFLQQLAKTGHVARIRETTVAPSGRASHRVPFGTGRKVGAFAGDPDDAYLTYHPETYRVLRAWIAAATDRLDASGAKLLAEAEAIAPELARYLALQDFAGSWDRIAAHCPPGTQRGRRFHQWFDAFRTLKLTHHLRDHGYPRQDLFTALGTLLSWLGREAPFPLEPGMRHDLDRQRVLCAILRKLC